MKHFPSKLSKGRVPDREYFWNIMHTFHENYVQELIKHAHEQRNSPAIQARAIETIEISDKWWEQLNAVPFISRKCPRTSLTNCFCYVSAQNTKARPSTCSRRAPSQCLRSANAARLRSKELSKSTRQLKTEANKTKKRRSMERKG